MQEIFGKYKTLEQIGEGGSSIVYRAEHTQLKRIVALKVFKKGMEPNLEIISAQALDHPNIIPIDDIDVENGVSYAVMRLIKDPTLEQYINENGQLDPSYAIEITIDILNAIDYAHKQKKKVLHRDVKPSNVFLTKQGAKLTDFDLAKIIDDSLEDSMRTQTEIVGTRRYMAPESEKGVYTPLTDIYGVGAVLFHMRTGEIPLPGIQLLKDNKKLNKVIFKALNPNPKKRYQTAKEFIQALEKAKGSTQKQDTVEYLLDELETLDEQDLEIKENAVEDLLDKLDQEAEELLGEMTGVSESPPAGAAGVSKFPPTGAAGVSKFPPTGAAGVSKFPPIGEDAKKFEIPSIEDKDPLLDPLVPKPFIPQSFIDEERKHPNPSKYNVRIGDTYEQPPKRKLSPSEFKGEKKDNTVPYWIIVPGVIGAILIMNSMMAKGCL